MRSLFDTSHEDGYDEGLYDGRAQGREEGREEGRTERSIEIARQLKAMGLTDKQIAEATGLDIQKVSEK